MALPQTLNFYTYEQLSEYSYETIEGTVYFSVIVTVIGEPDLIGIHVDKKICSVEFVSTSQIDAWECRATLGGASGVGIGALLSHGDTVNEGVQTNFDVASNQLLYGDGVYKIALYVQKDNIWYGG